MADNPIKGPASYFPSHANAVVAQTLAEDKP